MHIPNEPGDGEYLARGVYRARYKVQNLPALVAINSKQNAVKHVKLEPYDDELLAWKKLWDWLDAHDPLPDPPPPPVCLVKEEALKLMETLPKSASNVHPCQRDDQLTFRRRVVSRELSRIVRRYD